MKMYVLLGFFVLGLSLFLYSLIYEPYVLEIKKYTLKNPNLSGLKIVFASDFHVAPYPFENKRLQRVVERINAEDADMVILGGDFAKGHKKEASMPIENIAAELQNIKSRYGVFVVLGNHDTYYGKGNIAKALAAVGIQVLQNQNVKIQTQNGEVFIAGIKDYSSDRPDIKKALEGTYAPVILVSHSPDIFPSVEKADLIFAGHTRRTNRFSSCRSTACSV